jgi:hypothetical protein
VNFIYKTGDPLSSQKKERNRTKLVEIATYSATIPEDDPSQRRGLNDYRGPGFFAVV